MPNPPRRRHLLKLLGRSAYITLFLLLTLFGYGISSGDADAMRRFLDAVGRWQVNPDFPAAADEYVRFSVPAMRTHLAGISATRFIMTLRSIPGLPENLAVSPTSQTHYDNFTRGPLSAYLHLSGEQGLDGILPAIERLGSTSSDDDARVFLASFAIDPPVVTDAGAVAGTQSFLHRIDASRPLTIRGEFTERLGHHIADVATGLHFPTDPVLQTAEQQALIHECLDAHIRAADPELWRTKQVNDFLCGIWAQCYGQTYGQLLRPLLVIRSISRIGAVVLLVCAILWYMLRRHRGTLQAPTLLIR